VTQFRAIFLLTIPFLHAATNVTIYQEDGRYGGWPANHGIWSWGNEIVVGFSAAYYKHQSPERHQYDNTKPEEPRLARSLDGGETWAIEAPKSLLPPEQGGPEVTDLPAPMDFRHPDFAMTIRFAASNKGPSRLWYSTDRGKSWRGPYRFPDLDQPGIAARTDYLINGKRDAFVFLTAAKQNRKEGRVVCARTQDGGMHWRFVSYLGAEPVGFSIMPSSVRISPSHIVTAVRVKEPPDRTSIDLYESTDNAASWHILRRPVPDTGGRGGNPPSMIRLRDGRLCLTYGYRANPYAIRARLSSDGGETWSDEISLRSNAPTWEVGYPRTVQRPDGKVVTIYYWAGIIAATIWDN
jgi:BNR repeat-like domain